MRGSPFFLLRQRGVWALEIRERGKRVKIENGSKAVKALSFIFTVSVLNSSLAYVTVTWYCRWYSWMCELELLLTFWYWCSWMYGWKMVWNEHSYICYLFCLFPSRVYSEEQSTIFIFIFFICHCYDMFLFRLCYCLGVTVAWMSAGNPFEFYLLSGPHSFFFFFPSIILLHKSKIIHNFNQVSRPSIFIIIFDHLPIPSFRHMHKKPK